MGQSLVIDYHEDQPDSSQGDSLSKSPQAHENFTEGNTDITHEDQYHKDNCSESWQESSPSVVTKMDAEAFVKPFHADSHQPKRASHFAQNFKSSVTDYSQELDEQTQDLHQHNLRGVCVQNNLRKKIGQIKSLTGLDQEVTKQLFDYSKSLDNLGIGAKFEISKKCEAKLIKDSFFEGRESMITPLGGLENTFRSFGKLYPIESLLSSSSNLEFDARMN